MTLSRHSRLTFVFDCSSASDCTSACTVDFSIYCTASKGCQYRVTDSDDMTGSAAAALLGDHCQRCRLCACSYLKGSHNHRKTALSSAHLQRRPFGLIRGDPKSFRPNIRHHSLVVAEIQASKVSTICAVVKSSEPRACNCKMTNSAGCSALQTARPTVS